MNSKAALIILGLIVVGGLLLYFTNPSSETPNENEEVACTMDARICPDGSSVGRVPPSCEFAACPAINIPSDWETFSDDEVSFRYPAELGTEYISTVDWPPQVNFSAEGYECTEAGAVNERAGLTEERTIGNRTYCVTTINEGAAGSVYQQFAFMTTKDGQTPILTFSLRRVQCGNYDAAERAQCEAEQDNFNLDPIVDQIVTSMSFPVAVTN